MKKEKIELLLNNIGFENRVIFGDNCYVLERRRWCYERLIVNMDKKYIYHSYNGNIERYSLSLKKVYDLYNPYIDTL